MQKELTISLLEQLNYKLDQFVSKMDSLCDMFKPQKEEEWLDTKSAARFLNASVRSIMNWKQSGIIPSHKVGGRLYFKRTDLQNVIENAKV